jgi:hypothetical protein
VLWDRRCCDKSVGCRCSEARATAETLPEGLDSWPQSGMSATPRTHLSSAESIFDATAFWTIPAINTCLLQRSLIVEHSHAAFNQFSITGYPMPSGEHNILRIW